MNVPQVHNMKTYQDLGYELHLVLFVADDFSYFSGQESMEKSKAGKLNAPNYNIELRKY